MFTVTERNAVPDMLDGSWHFQQFAEKVAQVFWVLDALTGDVVYVSPAYERVWGCDGKSRTRARIPGWKRFMRMIDLALLKLLSRAHHL